MFKPHFGICICHNEKRLIVVKKGYCAEGNHEKKQKGISNSKSHCILQQPKNSIRSIHKSIDSEMEYFNECNESFEDGDEVLRINESGNSISKRYNKKPSSSLKTRKPIFKPKKGTGEKEIFAEIAEEREWVCFVTGKGLTELTATQFAHVLPKALNKYPLFKLYKENIVLLSNEAHYAWDFKSRDELRKDRMFDKLFELEEKLKEEYKLLKQQL